MKTLPTVFLLLALSGCASTGEALARESAASIAGARPESVRVENVDRGVSSVSWDAITDTGVYRCSGDDMLRRVRCFLKSK